MIAGMVLMAGLSLTGCKLIDQTTFAPAPEATAVPVTLPRIDRRAPLVTIGYDQPNPQYHEMLGYAVHAAEARSAAVQYDVFAGVPAERIHLGVRSDPGIVANQVRVYVR